MALSDSQAHDLEQGLQHMNVSQLLDQLYECIMLRVIIKETPDREDYVDSHNQRSVARCSTQGERWFTSDGWLYLQFVSESKCIRFLGDVPFVVHNR